MRCDDARRVRLDLELGEAAPADRARADAHRASCPTCRAEEAAGRAMIGGLGRLGDVAVPAIDVRARVAAAIAAGLPPSVRAADVRWLATALAAALACLVGLGAALATAAPQVRRVLDLSRTVAADLGRPILALAGAAWEVLATTLSPLAAPFVRALGALNDGDVVAAAQAFALAAVLVCLGSSLWIVGRELRNPSPRTTEEP